MKVKTHEVRQRLVDAVAASGKTPRSLSIMAGLGPNYLAQMQLRGTSPTIKALIALCNVLDISLIYVISGTEFAPGVDELLELFSKMDEKTKELLLSVARQLKNT